MKKKTRISKEELFHFNCPWCEKWWSIGDFPEKKKEVFCPWCGKESNIEIKKK